MTQKTSMVLSIELPREPMPPNLARSLAATLLGALLSLATAQEPPPSVPSYRRSSAPVGQRINDLMRRMTLDEKFVNWTSIQVRKT